MNQNQGSTLATIFVEPRTKDVDVAIVTCGGATTREDGPCQKVRLAGKKKGSFDIATERDIFFKVWDVIERNLGKSPIYEIPSAFDSSLEAGPLVQHGTLQHFFESFLLLIRDTDDLEKIENLLHQPGKE